MHLQPLFVCLVMVPISGLHLPEPYGHSVIDYSAMNEYVKEHYGSYAGGEPYFLHDRREECIYSGRAGVLEKDGSLSKASLHTCGFQLVSAPSRVTDWNDKEQLRNVYLPELREIFEREFGPDNIQYLEWFHPMLRGEDLTMTQTQQNAANDGEDHQSIPTSPTAAMAHIDNDIGAFELERVVNLVQNNCISYTNQDDFPRQELINAIQKGYRFVVINCWRNAGTSPIQRAPLGIFATRYPQAKTDCFPANQPDFEESKWYVFPDMTTEELLLFKQYDRDLRFDSDLWHCALQSLSVDGASSRRSFDLRAFLVLKEQTPERFDRYHINRLRPILSYEESEKFCRAQGEARRGTETQK